LREKRGEGLLLTLIHLSEKEGRRGVANFPEYLETTGDSGFLTKRRGEGKGKGGGGTSR